MNLLLIGCGNVGSILLDVWSRQNFFEQIFVLQPSLKQAPNYKSNKNIHFISSLESVPDRFEPDIIVLAIKPQILLKILPQLSAYIVNNTILISLLAGTKIEKLNHFIQDKQKIIRLMPNIAIKTGQSVNLAYANNYIFANDIELISKIFNCCGSIIWLKHEELIDILTPISASGPAYFYLLAEVLVQFITELGLEENMARSLIRQTLIGTASLINEDNNFEQLISSVASKGGVTEAALKVLRSHLPKIMSKALEKAQNKVKELNYENRN